VADAQGTGDPLAIICGGGSFPGAVADAVARRGRRPVMFGLKGWADAAVIERYAHHWIADRAGGTFLSSRPRRELPRGFVHRHAVAAADHQLRLDWQTIKAMPRLIIRFFRGGDDRLFPASPAVPRAAAYASSASRMWRRKSSFPKAYWPRRSRRNRDQGRHRPRAQAHCRAGPVRRRAGRDRRQQSRACGRSGGRHR
jgi:hypothetical protein